jgi:hypothetical protein
MPDASEVWQVDVNGTVYDAAFGELPEWIDGGSLLPGDKVRKGNLRWIEARRVPSLIPFFNAKEKGEPMPVVVSVTEAPTEPVAFEAAQAPPTADISPVNTEAPHGVYDPSRCVLHADLESFYLCDGCASGFCKACPNSYGGTVKICPLCGAMCRPASEVKATQQKMLQQSTAVDEGFGIADFVTALGHPFNYKTSLFFGAGLFALFTLGQSAASLGGIFLMVSALFCMTLSNMLSFGVLSNTVDNFIQGKLDANFMPDFENFEIWDDIVHPFFLSIAAYLVSFGPFLLTLAVGFYLVLNAVQDTAASIQSDLERIPGTHMYAGRELADQSGDVKEVLERIDRERAERIANASNQVTLAAETADSGEFTGVDTKRVIDEESRGQEELWAMATESRKKSLESAIGKTPETMEQERAEMFKAFLQLAAPLVVVGFITFLWGCIFFPAACAVAGYSKSFIATINPLVGLDTMKRLGGAYLKILAMGFVLVVMAGLVSIVVGAILSPLNLPRMGNVPATGITALFTFYFWTVFSCIIGYALFKKADKLGLVR